MFAGKRVVGLAPMKHDTQETVETINAIASACSLMQHLVRCFDARMTQDVWMVYTNTRTEAECAAMFGKREQAVLRGHLDAVNAAIAELRAVYSR